ncbi:tyrosinase family protein [Hymenobacter ruricola]|uniref:Tyrosinase family protein n=1 Tax=Hymenobacter ruricola TaxID=2791023 RepID=A0ABS0HZN9_9BACT|nr:tyrosinase family protein [Hymenobacter ruricola]MBF9220156.1 tyrosinase family protein [Hymenobacter ruricola]
MNPTASLRTRRSIVELQQDHAAGNPKPLDDLMRAWKGIKELNPDDPRSFFNLGGYHGEPFRGEGETNGAYWGGYCNHGNVLFPTWHRVYCLKVEEALQSIPGCEDVMLPYWDQTTAEALAQGIPTALTDATYTFATGEKIPNPLLSFTFPVAIVDQVGGDNSEYSKPAGYETVRYPLSGLVGTPADQQQTTTHNAQYADYDQNVKLLNGNIVRWLQHDFEVTPDEPIQPAQPIGILKEFEQCLQAPNYTVFSNTTSAQEWNTQPENQNNQVMPLEQPHNDIHLATGGFDVPSQGDFSPIPDANGDMGENDTAALDPIFYFHHCNVDRVFWLWQKRHNAVDQLEIIDGYHGTSSSDSQGPTPGFAPDTPLNLDSPLNPFQKLEGGQIYTSRDCINIETQLGYTYSPGSLEDLPPVAATQAAPLVASPAAPAAAPQAAVKLKTLHVSRINKAPIKGSFIVVAYANVGGKKRLVGYKSVLSRWDSGYCLNCQTHLEVKAAFPLMAVNPEGLTEDDFTVELITRGHNAPQREALLAKNPYLLELR